MVHLCGNRVCVYENERKGQRCETPETITWMAHDGMTIATSYPGVALTGSGTLRTPDVCGFAPSTYLRREMLRVDGVHA